MVRKFENSIQVTHPSLPPLESYITLLKKVWDSAWLTNMGPLHMEFEKKLQAYLKMDFLTLFTNGHLALESALKVLELKGDVITTPFTFASTVHAISQCGLNPVFCDIKANDYTIDEAKIEALITSRTCAILPVHVYGYPCNVKRIAEIAKKNNLKVIYDAAHVFGVKINEVPIGCYGDISMFSFHATKVFHTIEGGMLTYKDETIGDRLNALKNFGIIDSETISTIGFNAKMNEFQAAMGLLNLELISQNIQQRKMITITYRNALRNIPGIRFLDDSPSVKHNYAYFPIEIDSAVFGISRDLLHDKLKEYNIFTRKYFYPLANDYDCYKQRYSSLDTPIAKDVSERILVLPLSPELSADDTETICDIIRQNIS